VGEEVLGGPGVLPGEIDPADLKKGELIIRQGESNRDLHLLMKGTASIKPHLSRDDHQKRLFTFTPGVIFGEMGLLDGKPRSADIFAEEDSAVLILPPGEFDTLREERPQIAIKLMMNIGKIISRNLRLSNQELRTLEEG
jgi:CRP-like cAMP-binding protein